jgi:diaminopimelate epimerase
MPKIDFTKIVASGNDFVIVQFKANISRLKSLAQKMCDRRYGVGADGLLVLEKSRIADVKMRIFNPDGSQAQMCGNGARSVALWAKSKVKRPTRWRESPRSKVKIETKAGIINAQVNGENVKIKLTDPTNLKLNLPIKVNKRTLHVNFINTGVPHAVIFVADLDKIEVVNLGRQIRYHKRFTPAGTNVDFVEVLDNNSIKIRTYERGVEDETLACGTGVVAAALLYAKRYPCLTGRQALSVRSKLNILTKSREVLKVYFNREGNKFKNVWLEGKARIVYKGAYYV